MEEINIKEFKNLDKDSQIDYLTDLEYEEDASFRWKFFYSVLEDLQISDLTRIEVLNIFGANYIPKEYREDYI